MFPQLLPPFKKKQKLYSQVGDPSLPDSCRDGFHGCADGVEQVGQLTCSVGPPALLQDEPGEGHHVGIEGSSVRHFAVRCGTGT